MVLQTLQKLLGQGCVLLGLHLLGEIQHVLLVKLSAAAKFC
jgi:hypothetical protein